MKIENRTKEDNITIDKITNDNKRARIISSRPWLPFWSFCIERLLGRSKGIFKVVRVACIWSVMNLGTPVNGYRITFLGGMGSVGWWETRHFRRWPKSLDIWTRYTAVNTDEPLLVVLPFHTINVRPTEYLKETQKVWHSLIGVVTIYFRLRSKDFPLICVKTRTFCSNSKKVRPRADWI